MSAKVVAEGRARCAGAPLRVHAVRVARVCSPAPNLPRS